MQDIQKNGTIDCRSEMIQAKVKIVSWNVNSINVRIENVRRFISECKPQIIMFQELKCARESFPYEFFDDKGYNIAISSQKARNGVAIASIASIEDIFIDLMGDGEARYVECCTNISGLMLRVACVYVPNGGSENVLSNLQYKLMFLKKLRERLTNISKFNEVFVIGGDFNVAPEVNDVFDHQKLRDSICFTIEEREAFRCMCESATLLDGWRMLNWDTKREFSWWDYRGNSFKLNHGMRIDNLLLSPQAADCIDEAVIYRDVRSWERPSDHTPISITLRLKSCVW